MEANINIDTIREPNIDPLADLEIKIEYDTDMRDVIQHQFMLVDPASMKHLNPDANCLDAFTTTDPLSDVPQWQDEASTTLGNELGKENIKVHKVMWNQEKQENDALLNKRILLSGLENYHCFANLDETSQSNNQSHTDENKKLCKCNQCRYRSESKWNLNRHILAEHTKEKLCKRTMCNDGTPYYSMLKTHMVNHIVEMKYSCTICSFETAYPYNLTVHLKRHMGEKKFSCPECIYKTYYKYDLKKHIAGVHRNDKRYGCSECSFQTAYHCSLKTHMVRHKRKRECFAYNCSDCTFKTQCHQTLTAHRRHLCRTANEEASQP